MKWIKLFEGFNSGKEESVINDIKMIAYILEDDGYQIYYLTKDDAYSRSSTIYGHGGKVPEYDIRVVIKLPQEFYKTGAHLVDGFDFDSTYLDEFYNDVNYFLTTLKDYHLDYVSDIKLDILTTVCMIDIKL